MPGGYPVRCIPAPLSDLSPSPTNLAVAGPEAPGCIPPIWLTVTWVPTLCRIGVVGDLGETANSTQTVAGLIDAQLHVVINVGDYSCEP